MNANARLVDHLLQNRIVAHILFWMFAALMFTFLASLESGQFSINLIKYLALLPAQLAATYSFVYYLIPELLLKKKYGLFAALLLLSHYLFAALARLSIVYLAEPFFRVDFEQESLLEILADPLYLLAVYVPAVYLIVLIFFTLKSIKDRFEEKHQTELLQKEKATNELKFLKAQIHPHFLFNTLNNLYSLTQEASPKAPEVVLKLSEILDYMLYQCADPKVPIAKEIALLQNYIELESLRYGDKLDLTFEQTVDQPDAKLAPLILLSIVENAFKHGASQHSNKSQVAIKLNLQNEKLTFETVNTKPTAIDNPHGSQSNGIGSANIKRQLELIYPNKYHLNIDNQPSIYILNLEIDLA